VVLPGYRDHLVLIEHRSAQVGREPVLHTDVEIDLEPFREQRADDAHRADFAAATNPVFWVIAGLGVGVVALGLVSTGARARASAERVAFLLDAPANGSPSLVR
jgi:hypothetical protein